jgi:hypothetical protein
MLSLIIKTKLDLDAFNLSLFGDWLELNFKYVRKCFEVLKGTLYIYELLVLRHEVLV